jgi:hypothetical protein
MIVLNNFMFASFLSLLFFAACQKQTNNLPAEKSVASTSRFTSNGNGWGTVNPAMVLTWNDAAIYVVQNTPQAPPNPPIPPFIESRYYAMVNVAMHDALNNIVPKYKTYALDARDKDADPNAAVAKAAHDVILFFFGKLNPPALFTPQPVQDYINNLLAQSLGSIADGDAKTKGIALGAAAAQAIIQNRSNDGVANVMFPVTQGTLPGQYRFTAPFDAPPFNGFYDSPGWGDLKTFGIQNSTQFPLSGPYIINSDAYTADYNEIKRLGCVSCTGTGGRTQDQENIAKFWVENSPFGWNKIAGKVIAQNNLDAWKVARLFALLQMSEADAYIASTKGKITYFFWRPVTAVQMGDNDGNPNTVGDPNWQVLWFPTPPVADYPSAHATAGGAGAELIKDFFGRDDFEFSYESSTLPGQPRSFTSLSQAARENSLSRIYVGYHFRKACMDGEALGKNIGAYIATHSLQEN